ncbi:MAG: Cytochrome bd-I ubiquinol oxidase subunit 2 [Chlamydiia bacterium]|nr:Cytochrome bd-I ubiquinol oxidase subunit 2 [Chlamydiia bacterium]MCH9615817.1 Cytochrome bd-I ubiquinol oxidase subunit 2 [Chlamydiia bacterium]MCH9628780.1 Cytochrome bd-I ubiquinol oxidase subunit 2 [Chlamydiia bacterium]
METTELFVCQNIWYLVLCISVVFYTVLDGFDIGVGILHPLMKGDTERRTMLNSIGPIWDGNAVWFVIIGGAMFAGFPLAYSTLCSAFYTPIMILLCGTIFRAVAIEFRSKMPSKAWRSFWDYIFFLGSLVIAFVIGVLLANLVTGIPLDSEGVFVGNFWGFFHPYTVLIGLTSISLFAMHGSIFVLLKTEGPIHEKMRTFVPTTIALFCMLFFLTTVATLVHFNHMAHRFVEYPWLILLPLVSMVAIAAIPRFIQHGRDWYAFLASCLSIASAFSLFGVSYYPQMIRSSLDPTNFSITLFNSSANIMTFKVILTVAVIGVPLVLLYGWWIYRIFRGKVQIDPHSY